MPGYYFGKMENLKNGDDDKFESKKEKGEEQKSHHPNNPHQLEKSFPEEPVGTKEDLESGLGHIRHKISGVGEVLVEYIGHNSMEEKSGVYHVFYFRSEVLEENGKLKKRIFWPEDDNKVQKGHLKKWQGGNRAINKWFKEILRLEIGEDVSLRNLTKVEWASDESQKGKGYFKYLCEVPDPNYKEPEKKSEYKLPNIDVRKGDN